MIFSKTLCTRSLWVGASLLLLSASASAEDIYLNVTISNIFNGGVLAAVGKNAQQSSDVWGGAAFDFRNDVTPINFKLRYLNDGNINFEHPVSGWCIYAETNGNTVMGNCNHDRAKWQLIPNENGSVLIKNVARNGCLTANGKDVRHFKLEYPGCPLEGQSAHASTSWVITPWRGNSKVVLSQ
ncbi:hypothetical protein EVC45_30970 [Paraburkholderia sp. UYCP14C]|uniref:hypothetical protein n=1 Tax=Paraburkholderia sp. UYCP14C TaxID=2511130 RepID=UPI001020D536|nr:hypothetical protein [Paraburkholderia sp. UYCP14C]RZF25838.1 hypothetical protein EVC45_30970 [Paraburkholderia sp. UYCP14C]